MTSDPPSVGSAEEGPPLSTGWEPEVPDDDTVVRQFVLALAGRLRVQAEAVDGRWQESDRALLADGRSAAPYENGIVLLRPPVAGEMERLVEEIRSFFPRERRWILYSPFPLPPPPADDLELVGHPPFMFRPAGGSAPPPPPGLEIGPVETDDQLRVVSRILAASFEIETDDPESLLDPRLRSGPARYWLGRVDGEPVGLAGARAAAGLTEVAFVGTLAAARGRGVGEALTWTATLSGGSRPAGLLASDPGRPIYERMGYLSLLRFTLWSGRGGP